MTLRMKPLRDILEGIMDPHDGYRFYHKAVVPLIKHAREMGQDEIKFKAHGLDPNLTIHIGHEKYRNRRIGFYDHYTKRIALNIDMDKPEQFAHAFTHEYIHHKELGPLTWDEYDKQKEGYPKELKGVSDMVKYYNHPMEKNPTNVGNAILARDAWKSAQRRHPIWRLLMSDKNYMKGTLTQGYHNARIFAPQKTQPVADYVDRLIGDWKPRPKKPTSVPSFGKVQEGFRDDLRAKTKELQQQHGDKKRPVNQGRRELQQREFERLYKGTTMTATQIADHLGTGGTKQFSANLPKEQKRGKGFYPRVQGQQFWDKHEPKLRQMHKEGKSDIEIAQALGKTRNTIMSKRWELGLPTNNPNIISRDPKHIDKVAKLHKKGHSASKIGSILGLTKNKVIGIIRDKVKRKKYPRK